MTDSLGSELAKGDQVTLTGKVVAIGEDKKITVRVFEGDDRNGTLVQIEPANVTKQGSTTAEYLSDMTKAARQGFNDRNG